MYNKKIQLLRNGNIYTPSNGATALQTAMSTISQMQGVSDGEVILARYRESQNSEVKTLLCIHYDGSTETGWTFIGGLRAEIEETDEIIAQALSNLDERVTELEEQSPIEYTETDPVFEASPAHGITSSDITNWNNKTSNVGTVTGVKMNNTTNNPTDGVVDLGTVITSETQLSKGSTTGSGNAVTDITVNGHQITLTKGSTFLTSHQSIKTINGNSLVGTGDVTIIAVPSFTSADNGKILGVVNGQLAWVTPTTIYTGSGAPSSSQGNDGDIYLQTN